MQIKTTINYYFTLVGMVVIKVYKQTLESVEKREPSDTWQECKLVQPLQKTVWGFLKKN